MTDVADRPIAARALRYLLAVALVGLAFVGRFPVAPILGKAFAYILFYPAIMLVARYGGIGPGIVATVLSGILAVYFYLEPTHTLFIERPIDRLSLAIFTTLGLMISWSAESLRRGERRQRELVEVANERAAAERATAERLAATRDELLTERQRVVDLVRDVPGVVWQAWGDPGSPGGQQVDFVSGYSERLLGYPTADWLRTPNFWLAIVHPDDRERTTAEAHQLYQAGFGGVIEFRWLRRDRHPVWIELHVRTIQSSGASVGMRGVALDVSARKQLELERADLLAQAQASNQAKDEFLATVSHELRTPINAVLGWTQMLRAGILSEERIARGLESIDRNATALSRMIEDLLDVSRIAAGKLRLEIVSVDLTALVALAVDVVRPSAEMKGLTIDTELVGGDVRLRADAQRLEQAIWNVLANAVKFTPPGGRIRITLDGDADSVALTVRDSGEGIAPEVLPHIFERFRQGDPSSTRAHAGLGIGLALVRHIVDLHGGTVRAESDGRGMGTTIHLRLPRDVDPSMASPPEPVSASQPGR